LDTNVEIYNKIPVSTIYRYIKEIKQELNNDKFPFSLCDTNDNFVTLSTRELGNICEISSMTVSRKKRQGWTNEQIIEHYLKNKKE
jgi:hypothetical protein